MIIVMRIGTTGPEIERVVSKIEELGAEAHIDKGVERTIIGIRSGRHNLKPETFRMLPGVEDVVRILKPYKLASRTFHPTNTVVKVGTAEFGSGKVGVIAGPCSVESREQIIETAKSVKSSGACVLRGGAYKPRSSPYAFQGLGEEGLRLLAEAREATGLPIVTEVMRISSIGPIAEYADMLQVGARNMQNYDLLKEVAQVGKPVFIKRGMAARIEDLLMSAEYLLDGGCDQVILCERGIRTFENSTRNTLDITAVPVLKKLTHLPVVIDPSHASGHVEYVKSLALAAVAAGADGLMIEVHPQPDIALCDGEQSLTFEQFSDLMETCTLVAKAISKDM